MGAEGPRALCYAEGGTASIGESDFLAALATDSVPDYRFASSISQQPVFKTLTEEAAAGCTTCGHGGGDSGTLHRLKQDGVVRLYCSSCILYLYKGMYCSLCLLVYGDAVELGDPALWLTCAKCQRLSHVKCARDCDLRTDTLFFSCHDCSNPKKAPAKDSCICTTSSVEDGALARKKLRLTTDFQGSTHISVEETLAAAHIVACLASNQAKDAKARARASAAAAAKAAARAKAVLDTAYRAAREEAKWRHEFPKSSPALVAGKDRGAASYSGAQTMDIRRLEGRVSIHDHLLSRQPPEGGQVLKNPSNVVDGREKTKFTAPYHKIKVPCASEAIQAPSSSLGVLPPQGVVFQKPQTACMQEVMEQSLHTQPSTASECVAVSSSPASVLDTASLLGTPQSSSSASPAQAHAGIPMAAVETNCSRFMVLIGHDSSGTSQLPAVSKNDLVNPDRGHATTDGSITASCPVRGILVSDTLVNSRNSTIEADGKELKSFSPGRDDAAVDDFVDVGALLSVGCDKERQLPTGFVEVNGDSAPSAISSDSALVTEKTSDAGSVRNEKCTDLLQSSDEDSVAEETKYAGQSNGTKLTGQQGKHAQDDSSVLATKVYLKNNQSPPIALHMQCPPTMLRNL